MSLRKTHSRQKEERVGVVGRRGRIVGSRESPESFKKEKVNDNNTVKPLDLAISQLSATMERKFPGD